MGKIEYSKVEKLLGGWGRYLKDYIESEDFYKVSIELGRLEAKNVTLCPKTKQIFRFLELCNPEDLKLIIIGQDPYPGMYKNGMLHATGIALDNSNSPYGNIQPSLRAFWEGLSLDLGKELPLENNLEYLCKEGVLLGNRALSVKHLKTGSLMGLFDNFWEYFFTKVINPYFNGIPIVFLGAEAKKLKQYVFEMSNPVFELQHPSFYARNEQPLDTKGVFTKINKLIEANNGKEFIIKWDKQLPITSFNI